MGTRAGISREIFLAIIALVVGLRPAVGDSIDPGETVRGEIETSEWADYYDFEGNRGDRVTILLLDEEDDPLFYVDVQLLGPGGFCTADMDSRGAMIRNYRLPLSGRYTIVVSNVGFTGTDNNYVLSLVSSGDTNDGGTIAYGDVVRAEILPDGDLDAYRFDGETGDLVTVIVEDVESRTDFDPHVDLVGPSGLVASQSGSLVAEIADEELDESGDYMIVVWGGEPDWGGGPYELSLFTPATMPTPTPTPIPLPLPDLAVAEADFEPAAPERLAPGDPVVLGAYVENLGQPAGPFWLEFWGSRTGGLTLDAFIADSVYVPGLGLMEHWEFASQRLLYNVPDGPYTVVVVADRPGMVGEWDEGNNRAVIGGKRLLVLRQAADVDLVVEGFDVSPVPLRPGQTVHFSGIVRNTGSEHSGPFWIEFWRSPPTVFPQLDRMVCDSILVSDLAPGRAIDLSAYPRTVYYGLEGRGHIGVFVDRPDSVNETDETNNYLFVRNVAVGESEGAVRLAASGFAAGGSAGVGSDGANDLEVLSADFAPAAPDELQPGDLVAFSLDVANRGASAAGPFYIEFWGSRTGGLMLDHFLADSLLVESLAPGETAHFDLVRSLYGLPDGPYTVVVVADRPGSVADPNPLNNRLVVAGKKLLTIRPQTNANLAIENFAFGGTNILGGGLPVAIGGLVRNTGTDYAGPFWVEFWASRDQLYPTLDYFVCDSILVRGLAPGQAVDLSAYSRTIYPSLPPGPYAIGCFVDRTDMINETDESDNYSFLRGYEVY